tara:strand:+ start:1095 stop:2099 length:1005 start_codon:yes stop_codon:yes gene_type:complete
MKYIYLILINFLFIISVSFADDDQISNPYELLTDRQQSLYHAFENCNPETDECLIISKNFYEEIIADEKLSNSFFLGYSTYWYGDTLDLNNKTDEAYKIWNEMISNKVFNEKQNYPYKVYALIALGWRHFTDMDILDDKKSFDYMKEAADYGNHWALNNLGVFYHMGRNTKKNMSKAFKNYKKAADLGNHWAHGNLADFYLFGWGGADKNYQKSIFQMKFSSVATYTVNDNFKLKCLLKNAKLPKNEKQFKNWMINYLIETKDTNGFQEIAWISENNEEIYKWQYLASVYSNDYSSKERAAQELEIMKIRNNLSGERIAEIKNKAHIWIKKNWK